MRALQAVAKRCKFNQVKSPGNQEQELEQTKPSPKPKGNRLTWSALHKLLTGREQQKQQQQVDTAGSGSG